MSATKHAFCFCMSLYLLMRLRVMCVCIVVHVRACAHVCVRTCAFACACVRVHNSVIAVVKDVPDVGGDRKFEIKTLSVRLGAVTVSSPPPHSSQTKDVQCFIIVLQACSQNCSGRPLFLLAHATAPTERETHTHTPQRHTHTTHACALAAMHTHTHICTHTFSH